MAWLLAASCDQDPESAGNGGEDGEGAGAKRELVESLLEDARKARDRVLAEFDLDLETLKEELEETGEIIRRRADDLAQQLEETLEDASITARVKARFLKDPEIPGLVISVATRAGHVTLDGKVTRLGQIQRAMTSALSVPEVLSVRSRLTLKEPGARKKAAKKEEPAAEVLSEESSPEKGPAAEEPKK